LLPDRQVSITDRNGSFRIELEEERTEAHLRVTHIGFSTANLHLRNEELDDRNLEIYLEPVTASMSPLTVLAHREMGRPGHEMDPAQSALLPIDSGAFSGRRGMRRVSGEGVSGSTRYSVGWAEAGLM
jgi:iron complex outermembrane recepter protein